MYLVSKISYLKRYKIISKKHIFSPFVFNIDYIWGINKNSWKEYMYLLFCGKDFLINNKNKNKYFLSKHICIILNIFQLINIW